MKYCADLHIHSAFSRGTSKALTLRELRKWALIKGINVLGTGDFTHPVWRKTLQENLIPDGRGFFALKEDDPSGPEEDSWRVAALPFRFCLSAEISSIYKKNGKTRKVHSLLFAPDLEKAGRISLKLEAIGNVKSDGRPILGLDPKHLVEIAKEVSPDCHLIPAHIWTPWFSVFGSHSGFDTLEECFEEMLPHIFALETGLSSDPRMNWRVSGLDRYTLVSNSDAHSATRLMREANLFDTDLSYEKLFQALKTREGFEGTIEFFPEEGKYHFDGHRKCGVVLPPEETREAKGICPRCGKPLTVGVMHRVLELADRKDGERPPGQKGFRHAVPLPEMLAELSGTGPSSKAVAALYKNAVEFAGNERTLLFHTPPDEIERKLDRLLAEAIRRLREGRVIASPGFDGEFGRIRLFEDGELFRLRGQGELFSFTAVDKKSGGACAELFPAAGRPAEKPVEKQTDDRGAGGGRQPVLRQRQGALMVIAGPGTGKTRTLTHWLCEVIEKERVDPRAVAAITFTFKAKEELSARLAARLGDRAHAVTVTTFHALCYDVITAWYPEVKSIYDDAGRRALLSFLFPERGRKETEELSGRLAVWLDGTGGEESPELDAIAREYQGALKDVRGVDVASLVSQANLIFEQRPSIRDVYKSRFRVIAVDEFQDINRTQYRFLSHLIGIDPKKEGKQSLKTKSIMVIGDPDQSIYGFRGGDPALFFRFQNDYQAAYATLSVNFRSSGTILKAAAGVIAHNGLKSGLTIRPHKGPGKKVTVTSLTDEHAEAEYVAGLVKSLVGGVDLISQDKRGPFPVLQGDQPWSFREIAVLARTHRVLETVARACSRHGIPFALRNERAFLSEAPYSLLAEIFRFFFNKEDIVAFQNIVSFFLPELAHEARAVVVSAHKKSGGEPGLIADDPGVKTALSGLERTALEALVRFLEFVEAEIESQGLGKGLFLLLEKLQEREPPRPETTLADQTLLEMARGYGNDLKRFVREVFLSPREVSLTYPAEKVSLLTFHAAKGLEFPVVIIVGAEEGITPQTRADTDVEEERRLFYVAMTRAGERLFLSHAGRREFFGKAVEQKPSRFLEEIPAESARVNALAKKKKNYIQPSLF